MSTYTEILYQIVFGSKNRTSFLNQQNEKMLFNYIAGIVSNKKCVPYKIGGYGNHLHLIVFLHPSESLSNLIREIKRSSHFWMHEQESLYKGFPGWQVGYGAFTYAYSSKKYLVRYVENQAEHHKKKTFQEELVGFLLEFGIDYDEQYLFK